MRQAPTGKHTVPQLPNGHTSASIEVFRRFTCRWYQLMMEPCSSGCGPNENSREDGRDCQRVSISRPHDGVYNKCIPGSTYRKSPLYSPGNAGKSDIVVDQKRRAQSCRAGLYLWITRSQHSLAATSLETPQVCDLRSGLLVVSASVSGP
jgi:hypothetical protein